MKIYDAIRSNTCVNIRRIAFLITALLVLGEYYGKAEMYPSIFWTPDNPVFSKPNYELKVFPYSRMHIVCPNPSIVLSTLKGQVQIDDLYENVWRVDEAGYNVCSARTAVAEKLLSCETPRQIHYTTFEFYRAMSPTFSPGKEYFFIATSNGTRNSLNSTSGGHCLTRNMRFKVYVCRDRQDARCTAPAKNTTLKNKRVLKQKEGVSPSNSLTKHINRTQGVSSNPCNNTTSEGRYPQTLGLCSVALYTREHSSQFFYRLCHLSRRWWHNVQKIAGFEGHCFRTKDQIISSLSGDYHSRIVEVDHKLSRDTGYSFWQIRLSGTKSETETHQKTETLEYIVAILATVAVLSIALNTYLVWPKCKKELEK